MKAAFYLLCLFLFSASLNAQKIEEGGDRGTDHTFHCPSYSFSDNGKRGVPLEPSGVFHISLAGDEGQKAIKQAKMYIEQRGGSTFLEKLAVDHIEITHPEKIDAFLQRDKTRYVPAKCEITYYVEFVFTAAENAKYRFGIFMDEKFNMLFYPPDFPTDYINNDFYNVMSPEKAYHIARKKHRSQLKDAESMALAYDYDLDSFVWEIKGEEKHINWRQVEYWIVKVHAVTGQVVGTQMKVTSAHDSRYF